MGHLLSKQLEDTLEIILNRKQIEPKMADRLITSIMVFGQDKSWHSSNNKLIYKGELEARNIQLVKLCIELENRFSDQISQELKTAIITSKLWVPNVISVLAKERNSEFKKLSEIEPKIGLIHKVTIVYLLMFHEAYMNFEITQQDRSYVDNFIECTYQQINQQFIDFPHVAVMLSSYSLFVIKDKEKSMNLAKKSFKMIRLLSSQYTNSFGIASGLLCLYKVASYYNENQLKNDIVSTFNEWAMPLPINKMLYQALSSDKINANPKETSDNLYCPPATPTIDDLCNLELYM